MCFRKAPLSEAVLREIKNIIFMGCIMNGTATGADPGGVERRLSLVWRRVAFPCLFFFILFSLSAGIACGAEKVVLQLRWDHQFQFAGYYAALWQGYYREAGLDVEIRSAITPEQKILLAVQEVAEGRADFGVGAADILAARDKGIPLVLMMSVFQQSAARFYALEKSGMKSPADLVGFRVARNANDLIDVELQAMLRAEGIDPAGVRAYPHKPGADHLLSGSVDVIPGYSITLPYHAKARGLRLSTLAPSNYGIDFYGDSLFSHERLIKKNPEIAERFTQASIRGWQYALENPAAVADRISRELPRNVKVENLAAFNRFQIDPVKKLTLYPVVELGHVNEGRWRLMHAILRESVIVRGALDETSFFYNPDRRKSQRMELSARVALPVMGILLFVALVSLFWNRRFVREADQRKRVEAALRESEERFRQIYEHMAVGVARISLDFRIEQANAAYCQMLGYTEEELIGRHLRDITLPEVIEENLRLQTDLGLGKIDHYRLEKGFIHKSGRRIHGILDACLVRDSTGRPAYFLGSVIDITEMKEMEAERLQWESERQQLQKAESLGRMAGSIAHYFNNQLGVVIGNLELALEGLPSKTGHLENLTAAEKAAEKAAGMGRLMLTYLGQSNGERVPLDLADLCRKNIAMFRAAMPLNASLETDLPSPGPAIVGDAPQIMQMLTNLLTNGWEAIDGKEGIVRLNVKTVSAEDIPSRRRFPMNWQPLDSAYACLEVTDNGCGMDDKAMEKLFDPFFSGKFLGRGMGLPVVLGIVKAHSGVVAVESAPGKGSVFSVFFPMTAGDVMPEAGKAVQQQKMEANGAILLVEDEEMLRNMAVAMLKRQGFSVFDAGDGLEAIDIFRKHQADICCVITDLTMPRMGGWEVLSALRKLSPDIPVILASGFDEGHVMAGKHSELPQVFLGKPYKYKELADAVIRALGSQPRGHAGVSCA